MIKRSGFLMLLDSDCEGYSDKSSPLDGEMAVTTIFCFFLVRNERALPLSDCQFVYAALELDISPVLPEQIDETEKIAAVQRCRIGQPFPVCHNDGTVSAVLRISASARVVTDNIVADEGPLIDIADEIKRIEVIITKIGLILRYWDCFN